MDKELQSELADSNVLLIQWEHCELADELIGRGGFTTAYKGTCLIQGIQRDVVFRTNRIKVTRSTRRSSALAVYDQARYDVSQMCKLADQTHVVRLYGVAFRDMNPVIVVEGWICDLVSHLESNAEQGHPVPWPDRLRFCINIASGLQALHNAGIVHGDIKAENVVLVRTLPAGTLVAKIADLGSAFTFSSDGTHPVSLAPERMYTFRSRYPELQSWERLPSQDIYGLGLLVWQVAMNGEAPYAEATERRMRPAEIEEMRLNDKDLDALMAKLLPDTDPVLVSIIRSATKMIPSERANLADVKASLKQLLEDVSNESDESDWTQIDHPCETLVENKAAMKDFENFAKSSPQDAALPTTLSSLQADLQNWTFLQCQEGAQQPLSGHSQYLLACCYHWGFGTDMDQKAAFEWLSRAVQSKSSEAQCMLGEFYQSGVFVQSNPARAAELFALSADARNDRAMALLGQCYYAGEGVAKNHDSLCRSAEKPPRDGSSGEVRAVNVPPEP